MTTTDTLFTPYGEQLLRRMAAARRWEQRQAEAAAEAETRHREDQARLRRLINHARGTR